MIHDYAVVPFRRWHLAWLEKHGEAEPGKWALGVAEQEFLERSDSWTGICDGEPIACAGLMSQWPGRSIAWAYLRKDSGRHMYWVTMRVQEHLAKAKGRVELTVRQDFEPGHRWAKMLGFEIETPCLRAFGPEGENHVGWVRVS